MKKLVLASNNKHKVEEIKNILTEYDILTLEDIGYSKEIIEDGETFEENALIKARQVAEFSHMNTIADDSGLSVDLLNGEPGVYSARYSKEKTDKKNIEKVLKNLNGKTSLAKFVSVIALVTASKDEYVFKGECLGKIITKPIGENGFGYDPIFYVEDFKKTFAELSNEEKNSISHRKKSLEKLSLFLKGEGSEN